MSIPPTEVTESKYDFSNVLDFAGMLDGIVILPMKSALLGISYVEYSEGFGIQMRLALGRPIGWSCLVPVELKFELAAFRNIKLLKIFGVSPECITVAGSVRQVAEKLCVQKTKVTTLREILLCDSPAYEFRNREIDSGLVWKQVKMANFSDNQITEIDKSINLTPKVKS